MSAHRTLNDLFRAFDAVGPGQLEDPGNAGTITVKQWGQICSVVTTAAQTRTLAQPTKAGVMAAVVLDTDGGDLTLTVTGGYDELGNTLLVFSDAGDFVTLYSVKVGSSYYWRVLRQVGAASVVATQHGAGVIGTGVAPSTTRRTENGTIITEIKIDLKGLASVGTANDVIGLAAGGVAYIGRNVVANNGIIYKIELICVQLPVGGDTDINVVVNSSAALEYDGAGGTTYGVEGGVAAAGQVVQNLVQGLTANHYFYLTQGGTTAAAYTAGQFIIRLHGHPVLT